MASKSSNNTIASKSTRKSSTALPRKTAAQKQRAQKIFAGLKKHYPDAHCELDYENPMQLLVAVILSAQSTDVGVNKATPALFGKFNSPKAFAESSPGEIETYIKSIGLYRNKAKAIHAAMSRIVEEYDSNVPDTMEQLLTLRGVARKTANVVLGEAFGKAEGVVVDTHVSRVSQRFNLTKQTDPQKIERDLMALFDRAQWPLLSHLLIWHGRYSCKARGDNCAEHPLCQEFCSNSKKKKKSTSKKTSSRRKKK